MSSVVTKSRQASAPRTIQANIFVHTPLGGGFMHYRLNFIFTYLDFLAPCKKKKKKKKKLTKTVQSFNKVEI